MGIELLCSAGTIITDLTVELLGSSLERLVGKDLGSICFLITAISTVGGLLVRLLAVCLLAVDLLAVAAIGALLLPSGGCDRECSGDSEFAEHVGVGGIGFDNSYLANFTAAYKLALATT